MPLRHKLRLVKAGLSSVEARYKSCQPNLGKPNPIGYMLLITYGERLIPGMEDRKEEIPCRECHRANANLCLS